MDIEVIESPMGIFVGKFSLTHAQYVPEELNTKKDGWIFCWMVQLEDLVVRGGARGFQRDAEGMRCIFLKPLGQSSVLGAELEAIA